MTPIASSTRPPAWVVLPALAASLLTSVAARAQTPVSLWGFQRACERIPDLDRQVEKELYTQHADVALLKAPSGQPLPACTGARCAELLRDACPQSQGRLLGGQVIAGHGIVRTRLWLYDLATGQLATQDDYCQSCVMLSAVTAHARQLIEKPHFGAAAPGPTPTYCQGLSATAAAGLAGPVFLTVFGDGKFRPQLHDALKQQLALRGRQILPVPFESKSYGLDELQRMVAGQRDAQVLGVNVQKDNKVQVFLFDQRTARTNAKVVNCADCGQDKDTLIARVQPEVASILDYCFGLQCGDVEARPIGVQPPAEACEPFPEESCPEGQGAGATPAAATGRFVDPSTAKIIKGLTWGAFAASMATAITLFAVSGTSAGTYTGANGVPISNAYDGAAWASLGLAGVLLGVSIPTTVVLHRAAATPVHPPSSAPAQPSVQCPN